MTKRNFPGKPNWRTLFEVCIGCFHTHALPLQTHLCSAEMSSYSHFAEPGLYLLLQLQLEVNGCTLDARFSGMPLPLLTEAESNLWSILLLLLTAVSCVSSRLPF